MNYATFHIHLLRIVEFYAFPDLPISNVVVFIKIIISGQLIPISMF